MLVVLTDRYGELSETFVAGEVAALRRAGCEVVVESVARPTRPGGAPAGAVWEDESSAQRMRAVVWLGLRHPLGVLRDLAARRRWRREEPVAPLRMLAPFARRLAAQDDAYVHVHFAAGAALSMLRVGRLLGVPWSVTAHAWDIYAQPANLGEKLRGAAFATSGCEYTVSDLRSHAERVHVIVMGVDGRRFARRTPHPGGRTVVAVGRLVTKKGFGDLVAALGQMPEPPARVVIAGDGPLRGDLERSAVGAGLAGIVELPGAVSHDGVRDLLEQADVLCMPCVVAPDGDRDSMPVVVKEALAMEVPVVATDEVGLPEVVRPAWGRLAPPGDPAALAHALGELLALAPVERAAMGRAGRAHVLEHCDADREAAKLIELIRATAPSSVS